eukprot:5687757-Pleurochrysis_carterae.AAC.1
MLVQRARKLDGQAKQVCRLPIWVAPVALFNCRHKSAACAGHESFNTQRVAVAPIQNQFDRSKMQLNDLYAACVGP